MSKASCVFVGLLLVLQFVSFSVASGESTDFVLRRVERLIDISTQLVKHSIKINAVSQNGGSSFAFVVPLKLKNYVASVLAVDATSGAKLRVGQPSVVEKPQSYVLYPIDLGRTVESSGSVDLRIELLVTHALKPFPNQINQGQSQLVRFKDNHYFFTPYVSNEQETKVKLSSPKFETYSYGPGAVNVKNDIISYGPYSKVQPFSHSDLEVHYENNSPFVVVRKLVKEYEVSHWGNLAVEETYDLEHTGAGLTGPFSRLDLQRQGAPGVVSKLTETLLAGASDVYYRDEIGNISTSNFNVEEDGTPKLQIQPRYILFGGWKINFYLGYNTPLHLYLGTDYQNSNVYVLNVTFGVDFEEPLVIDEEYVRIILPEGASDIQLHQPNSFSIERVGEEKRTTYLDTTGRPVLVLRKTNVVGGHNQYFQVTYHFRQINMLQEPLLLIGAFFLFFVTVMIYVRINLSISKANSQE